MDVSLNAELELVIVAAVRGVLLEYHSYRVEGIIKYVRNITPHLSDEALELIANEIEWRSHLSHWYQGDWDRLLKTIRNEQERRKRKTPLTRAASDIRELARKLIGVDEDNASVLIARGWLYEAAQALEEENDRRNNQGTGRDE